MGRKAKWLWLEPSCALARKRSANTSTRVFWQLLFSHSHPYPFQNKLKDLASLIALSTCVPNRHVCVCVCATADPSVKHGKCQWGHAQEVCKARGTCPVIRSLSKQCYLPRSDKKRFKSWLLSSQVFQE